MLQAISLSYLYQICCFLPVTQEVASSSLVHPATLKKNRPESWTVFFLTKLEQRFGSSNRNSLSHPATLKKNRPESWTVFSYQTQTAVGFFKPQFFITSRNFEEEPSRKLDGFSYQTQTAVWFFKPQFFII